MPNTEEHEADSTVEVDADVSKFLAGFDSIKTEVGELKSFNEKVEAKQEELGTKVDTLVEGFTKFLENFNKEPDKEDKDKDKPDDDDVSKSLKETLKRETLIEKGGEALNADDAVDAGLRSIVIGSLDPDVKEIHLMSDLTGRNAFKPKPDPQAKGYNLRLVDRL